MARGRVLVASCREILSGCRGLCAVQGRTEIEKDAYCIVDMGRGEEMAVVVTNPVEVDSETIEKAVGGRLLLRRASTSDIEGLSKAAKRAEEAFSIGKARIAEAGLGMKVVAASTTLSGRHCTLFFTADGRIDFRKLVRDLARELRARVELRQIGPRDETGMMGGCGPCGRPTCCSTFLREFKPISIRMAKDQNLSLSPNKISGLCGRLFCCLSYEHKLYREVKSRLPRPGDGFSLEGKSGRVLDASVMKRSIRVKWEDGEIEEIPVMVEGE